jgi:thioesterase domain-containing protein
LTNRIRSQFGCDISLATLFGQGTIARQAELIANAQEGEHTLMVPIAKGTQAVRLVLVHPIGGHVLCYRELASLLPERLRIDGIQHPFHAEAEWHGEVTIEALARCYLDEMGEGLGEGRLILGGWSMGGVIAHEMAAQLEERGQGCDGLIMIDPWVGREQPGAAEPKRRWLHFCRDLSGHEVLASPKLGALLDEADSALSLARSLQEQGLLDSALTQETLSRLWAVYDGNASALRQHQPRCVHCRTQVIRASRARAGHFDELHPFDALKRGCGANYHLNELDEDHYTIVQGGGVRAVAQFVAALL